MTKQFSGEGWKLFVPSASVRKVINALADGFEYRTVVGISRTSTLTVHQVEAALEQLANIFAVDSVTRRADNATLYRLIPILD